MQENVLDLKYRSFFYFFRDLYILKRKLRNQKQIEIKVLFLGFQPTKILNKISSHIHKVVKIEDSSIHHQIWAKLYCLQISFAVTAMFAPTLCFSSLT